MSDQETTPSNGRTCTHCVLGGTWIWSWLSSNKSNDLLTSFLLQVPLTKFPILNICTGPTPTVNKLGNVVASSI